MNAESIALSRTHVGQISVPAEACYFRQIDFGFTAVFIKEAELDSLRDFGKQRKVRSGAVIASAQRIIVTGPDLHDLSLPCVAVSYAYCPFDMAWGSAAMTRPEGANSGKRDASTQFRYQSAPDLEVCSPPN
jgi:hypothetical protein